MACQWDFHPNDHHRAYWLQESNYTKQELVDALLDEYRKMMRSQCQQSLIMSKMVIFLGCLGILSATLALATLSRKMFSQVSFLYFEAVNIITIPYMVFLIEYGIEHSFSDPVHLRWYPWALLVAYGHGRGLINVLPAWINVIVLAAAVERVVACHLPQFFKKVNNRMVCITLIVSAFPICLVIYIPHVFAVELKRTTTKIGVLYEPVQTAWGRSNAAMHYAYFADSLAILGVVLHLVTGLLVVWGLIKRTRLRNSLKVDASADTRNKCIDLCYLQMCETLPLLIFHAFRVSANQTPVTKDFFVLPFSVDGVPEALANVRIARLNMTLQTVAIISGAVAHSMSFYFYIAFCPNIRNGFFEMTKSVHIGWCDMKSFLKKMQSSETELQTLRART